MTKYRKGPTGVGSPNPGYDMASGGNPTVGAGSGLDRPPSTDDLRRLIRESRSNDVVVEADRIIAGAGDPFEVARAYLMKIGALINLGRTGECPALVDRADDALRRHPNPALLGEFHALAGWVAHTEGSLDRGIMHLVYANRALETVERQDLLAADAWCDLAITFSMLGFHEQARNAVGRGHQAAHEAGINPTEHACPEVGVRAAISYDHQGDADRCRTQLVALLAAHDVRELSAVCRAIGDGRTEEALQRLERLRVDPRTLGAAEPYRLRALAHAAAGDYGAADAADRAAFRIASADLERVRALFVDGIAVRIDHEELRRTVGRYAGEALSDPLTGLANRRSLEQRVEAMTRDQEHGVLGVIDLDAFKAVNTVHGHLTGDLVLQRVATVLMRTLRRRDFLARYGGDEFVVILPTTSLAEADVIGRRLVAAVRNEDRESLVPGTPVSASVGWAELHQTTGLIGAFRKADRAMLDAKQAASFCHCPATT